MKKFKAFALRFIIYSLILNTLFLFTTLSSTASTNTDVKIYIDGTLMEFGTEANDPMPYIKDGRTLVPFRRIFDALGMEISWEPDTRMVLGKSDTIEIKIFISKNYAFVNGEEKSLDVAAEITDSRTFVPLRFVSENCGADVVWDGDTRSVYITLPAEVPSAPAVTPQPAVTKNTLREQTTYNGTTFSVDEVIITQGAGTSDNKITIKGKTNTKDTNLLLQVYNDSQYSLKARTFVLESETGTHEFIAVVYTLKSFVPKYILVKVLNEGKEYIKIAEYSL